MTLVELLAVSAILLMMAGTLGSLSMAVQNTSQFQFRRGLALQHAQVLLVRLQRQIQEATASQSFPGFAVFPTRVGTHDFPDTIVVWHPAAGSTAVDPDGMPRMNELVVYCPNPAAPQELFEITNPSDTRVAPDVADAAAWRSELDNLLVSNSARRIVLTDLLRVASVRNGAMAELGRRGVVRFERARRPSEAEWQQFIGGTRAWNDISWVQGIYSSSVGLCQSHCRIELQLRPGDTEDNDRDLAIPFFGSAAVYFQLRHP
jgi:hypothetical protein